MNAKSKEELIIENLVTRTRRLLEEKGRDSLETAKRIILVEKVECKEMREALEYFMTQYWHDLTTPTLLSLACEAVGGDADDTKPIAIPLIIISGAMDIHDDIIDGSKTKDDRATVTGKFGRNIALITGDFLLGTGFVLLNKACKIISTTKFWRIITCIKNALSEIAGAEALEISLQKKHIIKPEEYLYLVRKKAADIQGLMEVGSVIGDGSKEEFKTLGKYGRCLGMLSILRDDLIDLNDPKEIRHRISRECLPFPLLYMLANITENPIIASLRLRKVRNVKMIQDAAKNSDGFKYCKKVMNDIADECNLTLRNIKHQKDNLKLLIDFMLNT
jgi:geranylgeranyl pyrophosphate synthase